MGGAPGVGAGGVGAWRGCLAWGVGAALFSPPCWFHRQRCCEPRPQTCLILGVGRGTPRMSLPWLVGGGTTSSPRVTSLVVRRHVHTHVHAPYTHTDTRSSQEGRKQRGRGRAEGCAPQNADPVALSEGRAAVCTWVCVSRCVCVHTCRCVRACVSPGRGRGPTPSRRWG